MKKSNLSLINSISRWGNIIITLFVVLEVVFFYSLPNIVGCIMTIICWSIYKSIGLKEYIVEKHLFSWLVFTSMSLYRILPLIATFLELKPITYKFEVPYETFFWETLLYLVSSLAFYLAVYKSSDRPNFLHKTLEKLDFYKEPSEKLIWALGLFGMVVWLYLLFTAGDVEIGDVGGKFLFGFIYLKNAPILLFFPSLYKKERKNQPIFIKNNYSVVFVVIMIVLSMATNRRLQLLDPIITFVLLFVLSVIVTRSDYRKFMSFRGALILIIVAVFIMPIFSDISDAMLATRSIRSDLSKSELLQETWKVYQDKDMLKRIRYEKSQIIGVENYFEGWTEEYLDNFAFNRYANMRITDITLYHANRVGYANEQMRVAWFDRLLSIFPMPVLDFFGLKVDKVNIYSRGDLLYALSLGGGLAVGLRVTSHIADGLVTFGLWYLPIQFILFYLQFLLLSTFSITRRGKTTYSLLGLITIFTFSILFKNANGCLAESAYLIRGYIQSVVLFLIIYNVFKRIINLKIV